MWHDTCCVGYVRANGRVMRAVKVLAFILGLTVGANATAGWMLVDDSGATGLAINPAPANSAPQGPANQNATSIKTWLDDLTGGASSGLTLLDQGDSTPDVLSGLDALGATYIVLHYGNYRDPSTGDRMGNLNLAYECDGGACDSFNPDNRGLSNYRIYGTAVPEPGSLALLMLGLVGLAIGRVRRRS